MRRSINSTNAPNLEILHQLAGMLHCSLARYLSYARPWSRRRYSLLMAVLRKLASEHQHNADEIARLLESRRQSVSHPGFPTEYTYYNDVAVEHLAPKLLQQQRYLIGVARAAHGALFGDREVRSVLAGVLHGLTTYADLMQELLSDRQKKVSSVKANRAVTNLGGIPSGHHGRETIAHEPQTAA